ncbi:MAG: hypothetical protein ACTS3F_01630 [Phycisphaerales bacterium]
MSTPWYANVDGLRADGFTGFVKVRDLRDCKLASVPGKSGDLGVYIMLRMAEGVPNFLEVSTGGHFKGRDPSVRLDVLEAKWVPGSKIVYIGKAGAPGKSATLRSRLRQYLDFGAGRPVGHWGGRYTWHLPDSDDLVVCWKLTPNADPREVERRMIQEFAEAFGCRPFANLNA